MGLSVDVSGLLMAGDEFTVLCRWKRPDQEWSDWGFSDKGLEGLVTQQVHEDIAKDRLWMALNPDKVEKIEYRMVDPDGDVVDEWRI